MSWLIYTIALIAYYTLHSLMASRLMKSAFSKIGVKDQIYRILFNIVALGTSVMIFYLFQATDTAMDRFGSPVGIGLIIIGIALIVKSLINYDLLAFVGLKKEEKYEDLVTTSLTKYVRHPLYLGIIVALVGWNTVYISGAALATLIVTILYVQVGIYLEEKKLVDQFGARYVEYQKSIPKLIPRFWKG